MAIIPFSRKCAEQEKTAAVDFFQSIEDGTFDWEKTKEISPKAKRYISARIDEKFYDVYQDVVSLIKTTEEHKANYQELVSTAPNCKGFSKEKSILPTATPFEQMVAVEDWVNKKKGSWVKKNRTLCLAAGDDFLPVYIFNSRKNVPASLMTVRLGSARGSLKAPLYTDFASESDETVSQSIFLKPLEFLEAVRQPEFLGSTLLKANALASETITAARRFKTASSKDPTIPSHFACVELTKQKNSKTLPTKESSAACNIISLVKNHEEKPLAPTLQYEDFAEEGYQDEADIDITPKEFFQATKRAVCEESDEELTSLSTALLAARIGPCTSPIVQRHLAAQLFPEKE